MKDYYKRLGVKPDASYEEIRSAYRQLSKKYHPDMHGGTHTHAEAVFKEIQEAYQTLSDNDKRSFYDYQLDLYNNPPQAIYRAPEEPTYQYSPRSQAPYATNRRPYRQPVAKVNIFKSLTVWIVFGIGILWMVLMLNYYVNNQGKGGMDYATNWKSSSNKEFDRKYKLLQKYDQLSPFEDGVAWAYKAGWYELIDTSGKVLSKKYNWVGGFNEKIAAVKKEKKYGYIRQNGQELTPIQYEFAEAVNDGIAVVQAKNIYYILHFGDKRKKIELPGVQAVGTYSEGVLPIQMTDTEKWGYINAEGKGVIFPTYLDVTEFEEDLAAVKDTTSHLWGFINHDGKLVIPFIYEKVSLFKEGKARVLRNNKSYIIDTINRCIANCDEGMAKK